jgi:hypothetical protein
MATEPHPAHCTCESRLRGKGSTCRTCGKTVDLMASLEDSLRRDDVSAERHPGREPWTALAEISELFDGYGWEDADADELRGQVEEVIAIVNRVLPRREIEAAGEAAGEAT